MLFKKLKSFFQSRVSSQQLAYEAACEQLARANDLPNMKQLIAQDSQQSWSSYPLDDRVKDSFVLLQEFMDKKTIETTNQLAFYACQEIIEKLNVFFAASSHDEKKAKLICLQKHNGSIVEAIFHESLGFMLEAGTPMEETITELFYNKEAEIWQACGEVGAELLQKIHQIQSLMAASTFSGKEDLIKALEELNGFLCEPVNVKQPVTADFFKPIHQVEQGLKALSLKPEPDFACDYFELLGLWDVFKVLLKSIQNKYDMQSTYKEIDFYDFIEPDSPLGVENDLIKICDSLEAFYQTTAFNQEAKEYFLALHQKLQILEKTFALFPESRYL